MSKNLTVKFAGLEYECNSLSEADDLRLALSRAENSLRELAQNRAAMEGKSEEIGRRYAMQMTTDPQQICPAVMDELRTIEHEKREARHASSQSQTRSREQDFEMDSMSMA